MTESIDESIEVRIKELKASKATFLRELESNKLEFSIASAKKRHSENQIKLIDGELESLGMGQQVMELD